MGGDVRKEQIAKCGEDASFVRARSSPVDDDENWSVSVRPYRPRPAPDELRDQGDGCTCLLAGNRVAMADGSLRAIERVAAGDRVLTMSGAAAVRRLAKAAANVAKHRVTFAQAATVLLDPLALTVFDSEHSELEERWFSLGTSGDGKPLAVAHTYVSTTAGSARVRIISAREATRAERRQYENEQR